VSSRFAWAFLFLSLALASFASAQAPSRRVVELKAADGTRLQATYFPAAKPGPGVLLIHQSNRDRKSWEPVGAQLASAGIHTLTLDLRGHGGSPGTRSEKLSRAELRQQRRHDPEDIDLALAYLRSLPGVDRNVIGLGGAGVLGTLEAIDAARRDPKPVKSLVLMSGETPREGLRFLRDRQDLPEMFVTSDGDEYPPTVEAMELLYLTSSSPSKKLVHYSAAHEAPWLWYEPFDIGKVPATGQHGTDLFATHTDLPGMIVDWFVTTLLTTPGHAPADTLASADVLRQIEAGEVAQVKQRLTELRRTDPQAQLFPEISASIIGQDHMRANDPTAAVGVLELVEFAYPDSADAHDTLADAYQMNGQNDLARQHAQKALSILDTRGVPASSWTNTEQYRGEIRSDAEQVLQKAASATAPSTTRPAGSVFRDCAECPEMVVIPAGKFTMGSSDAAKAFAMTLGASPRAIADESPEHSVSVRSFALGKYDVTRGEYAAFVHATGYAAGQGCYVEGTGMDTSKWPNPPDKNWQDPGFSQTDRDPVVCVSWPDAKAYVAWLNAKTGGGYRLPTEAEWEYAARAGAATPFYWGDDPKQTAEHGWFRDNAQSRTHPVGQKPANAFGLYDIVGNVWQWTEDCYAEDYSHAPADGSAASGPAGCLRVDRGGSWFYPAWLLRSATRERNPGNGYRDVVLGLRVAKTLR
jgi:formylglycine-generating enzyme required for sulfatase activity/pimeloyl-ACP methyl ester carboxylesterase